MKIPQITNIETAIKIYYSYPEISKKEIAQLFSTNSKSTICKLKKMAYKNMIENDVYSMGVYKVNTSCAYKAWGIDIDDLEKRRSKLIKLGL